MSLIKIMLLFSKKILFYRSLNNINSKPNFLEIKILLNNQLLKERNETHNHKIFENEKNI